MAVGIYIRVSTEEQVKEGFSISAQREKLKAFCRVHDYKEYKFFVDEGISAKDTNRPQLQQLLTHIENGIIDTVLVYRLDRLTRSVLDLYNLLDIFEKYNCNFKSATEVYDTTTAMGRMFITLVAALAQWERENLGERVRMGQIEKARQGKYSAPEPFGFEKRNSKLYIKEDESKVIMEMIKKIELGYSLRQLALWMDNESGFKPPRGYQWHITSIQSILKNPVLYGATRWRDEIIENTHDGIIAKEEHEHLLNLLSDRQNKKKRKVNSFFVYQMKLVCPNCGNHLTSERQCYVRKKDGAQIEHNQYRCQACALNKRKAISVSEKKIDVAFIGYIHELSLSLSSKQKKKKKENKSEQLIIQIERIRKQREKYQKAWSNDFITDEEFKDRMDETKLSLANLEQQLSAAQENNQTIDIDKIKVLIKNFDLNWTSLEQKEKHEFLNMFVSKIYFEKNNTDVMVTNIDFY